MWRRNLLFLGLIVGGVVTALATFFPTPAPAERDGQRGREPASPVTESVLRVARDVDEALAADLAAQQLDMAPPADDLAIARRLSLALLGTIPSLAELRLFESWPPEERVDRWLGYCLADARFGDYLAERWARALVGSDVGPFVVYRRHRFVSWLGEQFRRNRPYDELVRELVSATGLWTDQPATNFLTVAINFDAKPAPDEIVLAQRVSRTFLGTRLECAQCHDHPFAPWKQHDFAALAAYFSHAQHTFTGLQDRPGDPHQAMSLADAAPVAPRPPFQPELAPDWGSRRWQLANWITHPNNRAFAAATVNRAWALLLGRPLIEPVDDLPLDAEHHPRAIGLLARDLIDHQFDLQRLLTTICATAAFRAESRPAAPAEDPDPQATREAEVAESPATWPVASGPAFASYPLTSLRPEQLAAATDQSATLVTVGQQEWWLLRVARYFQEQEFIGRFGDAGRDELDQREPTVPQRLLMMNGKLVHEATKPNPATATTRIALLAETDPQAVEIAYLVCLARRPTDEERAHFAAKLAGKTGPPRERALADLRWSLINSAEFGSSH